MVLLAVFSECKPEQFLACQSSSMLDGSKMPSQAWEDLKVAALPKASSICRCLAPTFLYMGVPWDL